MWKLLAFIVSSLLLVVVALPVDQSTIIDAKPIILEAVDLPTENAVVVELKPTVEEKPIEEAKPAELAFDAITDESNEPQPRDLCQAETLQADLCQPETLQADFL